MPTKAVRQCLGCRDRTARDTLLRLVAAPDGTLVVDLRGRLPGRGGWVHPRPECLEAIVEKPDRLHRTLRTKVEVGPLQEQVRQAVERALFHGLSLAAAGGGLVNGFDRLVAAIQEGRVVEVLVASDAASRTVERLTRIVAEVTPEREPIRIPWTRLEIGTQIGQGSCAVLGVAPMAATEYLRAQLQRFQDLG